MANIVDTAKSGLKAWPSYAAPVTQVVPGANDVPAADRLLERAYHLSGGDIHRPVNLQAASLGLGFSLHQTMLLLGDLVEQGCLSAVKEPEGMVIYMTPQAATKFASVKTRQ